MARLEIGQPEWVAEPLRELSKQRDLLVAPADIAEVAILVEAFKAKVDSAAEAARDWRGDERKLRAAEKRAAGDFAGARHELENVDLTGDTEAARLHALNALSLFEEDPTYDRMLMLNSAIREFSSLIDATTGRERQENVLSLLDSKFDLFELESELSTLQD